MKTVEKKEEKQGAQVEALTVYSIREEEGKSLWTKVGRAFVNRDGSLNLLLNALPTERKLHVRKARTPREARPTPAPAAG